MQTSLTPDQIGDRAEALYERIKNDIAPEHHGKFIILDVESGDYEIDEDDITAEERLSARRPNAVMYLMRVGNLPAWTIGGKVQ
jgi:hypothetical protein